MRLNQMRGTGQKIRYKIKRFLSLPPRTEREQKATQVSNKRRSYTRSLLLNVSLLLTIPMILSGCIHIGAGARAPINSYTFNVPDESIPHYSTTHKTIQVNIGQAVMGLRTPKMAYQMSDQQLNYFAVNAWLAPPASLLTPTIAQALTASNYFNAVIAAPTYGGATDYQLSVILFKLQQNFFSTNSSEEQVAIQLILIDALQNKPIAAKTFSMKLPCEPNPESGAHAANQAVNKLMPTMIQFIVTNARS